MIPQLADRPAAEALTAARQLELLAAVQDAPVVASVDSDGTETQTYGYDPAAESALAALTASFVGLFHKEAAAARAMDRDDAFAEAVAEFVDAARRHDLNSGIPFSATIKTIIRRHLSDVSRTSDIIAVRENVAARYWRLMHAHGFDVVAAYDALSSRSGSERGLDPLTFLAAHRALHVGSLDLRLADDGTDSVADRLPDSAAGPEDTVVNDALVEWLWSLVDDQTERIMRLRYGFSTDLATEAACANMGLHAGDVLAERQVAAVMGLSQSLVHRRIVAGLDVMRAALSGLINEEEA